MSLWPQNPYRHHRLCTSASSSVHIHDSIGEGGSLLPADGGRKRPSWVHKRVYKLGNGLLLNFSPGHRGTGGSANEKSSLGRALVGELCNSLCYKAETNTPL